MPKKFYIMPFFFLVAIPILMLSFFSIDIPQVYAQPPIPVPLPRPSIAPAASPPVTSPAPSPSFDPSVTGTCEWAADPPLRVAKNECKSGFVPTQEGSAFFPRCVCRKPGSSGQISPALLPSPAGSPTSSFGDWAKCEGSADDPGIRTAIGCIHTSPAGFIKDSLKFVLGIAGGLAFLMMLLGAFQMLTSAGNPDTLAAGRDRLTSAVIGLLFVIFALLLFQIIGIDILGIEGLKP